MSTTETMNIEETTPIIPKTCKAGVVCNPGPDFHVCHPMFIVACASHIDTIVVDRGPRLTSTRDWTRGSFDQAQCYRPLYVRCPLHDGGLGHATNVISSSFHKLSINTDNQQVSIRHQMCWSRRRRRHRQSRRKSQEPQDRPKSRTQTHPRCLPYLRVLQNWKRNILSRLRDDWSPHRW
jgi:hypothetical protein